MSDHAFELWLLPGSNVAGAGQDAEKEKEETMDWAWFFGTLIVEVLCFDAMWILARLW